MPLRRSGAVIDVLLTGRVCRNALVTSLGPQAACRQPFGGFLGADPVGVGAGVDPSQGGADRRQVLL